MSSNALGLFDAKTKRQTLSDIFKPLFDMMGIDGYGITYETPVFEMHPYCWCDKDTCPMCGTTQTRTTFHHKPSGFHLHWYKYAMRVVEVNKDLTDDELKAIVDECIVSLSPDLLTYEERRDIVAKRVILLKERPRVALEIRAQSMSPGDLDFRTIRSWTDEQCAERWAQEERDIVAKFGASICLRSQQR
jgi:hypothetical protein